MNDETFSTRRRILLVTVLCSLSTVGMAGGLVLDWYSIDCGGGMVSTDGLPGGLELAGTIGQFDAGPVGGAMTVGDLELVGGFWVIPQSAEACDGVPDCADADNDAIRDDNCVWVDCDAGQCLYTDVVFGDIGGPFGACEPDGFANIHDYNHALACFAGLNTCNPLNIDAGGAFGDCAADGFCNVHDGNHALAAFAGLNTCTCPAVPKNASRRSY